MKFEFLADASDTPPKRPSNPSVGYPSNGDPVTGKPPTTPGAWFYYMLMVEFTTLIEQNGLEPSAENLHQLADVFADFKARASAAEGFATQAKESADAAAESAASAAELDNYALSSALAEYAKKATTLAGYGITDAYTKSEVDSKVASAGSGASVDLSNYYTKSEADAAITTAISAITDGDSAGY